MGRLDSVILTLVRRDTLPSTVPNAAVQPPTAQCTNRECPVPWVSVVDDDFPVDVT